MDQENNIELTDKLEDYEFIDDTKSRELNENCPDFIRPISFPLDEIKKAKEDYEFHIYLKDPKDKDVEPAVRVDQIVASQPKTTYEVLPAPSKNKLPQAGKKQTKRYQNAKINSLNATNSIGINVSRRF
uniref:INCENP_ARK-bind domain-containing protein n=1 Tax=Rhabditophanes sp. KR3021 TaxID=114890 RepID=A0AC35UCM5_9BILA